MRLAIGFLSRSAPNFSISRQWVIASRPRSAGTTAIFSRWILWRPSAASTVPCARSGAPQTSARYSRVSDRVLPWSAKSFDSPWCAASVLATTSRPEVSLSSRCTMPGRFTPPMPESESPQWAISALTRVPVSCPAPGWTTSPAGLSRMTRDSSSNTMLSGMSSPTGSAGAASGTSISMLCATRTLVLASNAGAPSTATRPASIRPWMRVREDSR